MFILVNGKDVDVDQLRFTNLLEMSPSPDGVESKAPVLTVHPIADVERHGVRALLRPPKPQGQCGMFFVLRTFCWVGVLKERQKEDRDG